MPNTPDPTEWEEIATEPDAMTLDELKRAIPPRGAAPQTPIPASAAVTVPVLHRLLEEPST
jgi:hypothetical protein